MLILYMLFDYNSQQTPSVAKLASIDLGAALFAYPASGQDIKKTQCYIPIQLHFLHTNAKLCLPDVNGPSGI